MNIRVSSNSIYKELTVEEPTMVITSGLLDEQEAIDLAKELISAAEDLLPSYHEKISYLAQIREDL